MIHFTTRRYSCYVVIKRLDDSEMRRGEYLIPRVVAFVNGFEWHREIRILLD